MRRYTYRTALLYGALFVCALYFLSPLYVMLVASFKTLSEVRGSSIISLPEVWTIKPWIKAWSEACSGLECDGIRPYFIATFEIAIPAVAFSVLLGALNGYVMAKWRSRSADLIFTLLLVGSFVPLQLYLIPLAITLRELNIYGTTTGLILIHTVYGIPLTTMLFRNFYVSLPDELVRAAIMDGAGFFKIFFSVILPLSPAIAIVAVILVFSGIYNDFLFALTFGETGKRPIMAAVQNIVASSYGIKEYNVNIAAVMISALPTLLLFLLAGRFFVRGLTQGALKG
ncbi:MAG: carbohydrate ABC transporter permease [Rhodobacteraceae bacterium]|nr:carbohydrate ABC transporter permease [Paracoccaceae bacterium]MCY4136707.1 carbohydrate ABC transporter permease [Paracoccaceae bacterium]